jgi:hypothetical protein
MTEAQSWLLDVIRTKAMRQYAFDYATLWPGGRFIDLADFLRITGFKKSLKHCVETHSSTSGITRRRYVEWVCGHHAVFLDNLNLAHYAGMMIDFCFVTPFTFVVLL